MPRKRIVGARKAYKKRGKARTIKRRMYRKYSRKTVVPRRFPFGQSKMVRHKYIETFQLSTTSGAPGVYSFRINDMYDPNLTGSGHQPIGFDQIEAIYEWFTVVGAKIKLRVYNRDADEFVAVGIYISEQASIGALQPQRLIENGSIRYRIMPPNGTYHDGGKVHYLQCNVSVKKHLMVNNLLDEDSCTGTGVSSPQRTLYAHIIVWQPDSGLTNAGTSMYMELEQLAVWRRAKTLIQS